MKPRDAALRLRRFEIDEKARKVADLESMILDFEQMASDLDRQIKAEEDRTGIRDAAHFAYSTFARSAAQRRDNLLSSSGELRTKLEAAVKDRDEAEESFNRAQAGESRDETGSGRRRSERPAAASMR